MTDTMRRGVRRLLWGTSGANLIEAAFITPLLLLVTFAISDFASLLYVFLSLENGVSQATRYAVTGQQVAGASREESIMAAMRGATPTLTLEDDAFTFSHIKPGESMWTPGAGGPNDVGRVQVRYTWKLMTPLIGRMFEDGEIDIAVESSMKNERRWN
jgi:Flp pilus assembly protein TadG